MSGVRVLSKRLGIPVWFSQGTYNALKETDQPELFEIFIPGKTVNVGSLAVHSFLKNHDAAEPCSFRIEHDECFYFQTQISYYACFLAF